MKKRISVISIILISFGLMGQDANAILDKIDANMSADNVITEASMTIHGKRNSRTMVSKTYTVGSEKSFTEYLAPKRDAGTKMLKMDDKLWIYSPSTDRTIQISGHMLRQSVMGSDFSYEDMMDDRKLKELYNAMVLREEVYEGRKTIVLDLIAKVEDVAYYSRKIWVDAERFVPLKEELFAKSGQILKRSELSEFKQIQGRWYPMKFVYKDMLKSGNGTEMKVNSVKFNQEIPSYIFSKAALKQ